MYVVYIRIADIYLQREYIGASAATRPGLNQFFHFLTYSFVICHHQYRIVSGLLGFPELMLDSSRRLATLKMNHSLLHDSALGKEEPVSK